MSKEVTKHVIEIPDDIPLNPQFLVVYGTEPIGNKIRTYTIEMDDTEELERFYSVEEEAAVAVKLDVTTMHDIADGGVFAGLWQLAEKNGVGIEVDLKSIPVRQETIEVCEFFDINPYKLRSDGSLLIVTDKPEELIKELAAKDIAATLIGRVTDGHDKVIVASEEERRFLEQPRQDEITIL